MEFVSFKIRSFQKIAFERVFADILREGKIDCWQREFEEMDNYTIAKIPKYAIDKMTREQIDLLEEFKII